MFRSFLAEAKESCIQIARRVLLHACKLAPFFIEHVDISPRYSPVRCEGSS
jgi:hypothetical protein